MHMCFPSDRSPFAKRDGHTCCHLHLPGGEAAWKAPEMAPEVTLALHPHRKVGNSYRGCRRTQLETPGTGVEHGPPMAEQASLCAVPCCCVVKIPTASGQAPWTHLPGGTCAPSRVV